MPTAVPAGLAASRHGPARSHAASRAHTSADAHAGTTPRLRLCSHVSDGDPADDPATADIGTLSTIDVLGEGCFALRVVGWDGAGDDTASVYVDVRH